MYLPETGFLDLAAIIGQREVTPEEAARNKATGSYKPRRPRRETLGLIPVGHSTWWAGVRSLRFPQPIKIGRRTVWKVEDIRRLIDSF